MDQQVLPLNSCGLQQMQLMQTSHNGQCQRNRHGRNNNRNMEGYS